MEMAQLSSPRHVALIYPHLSGATPIQQSLSFILTAVKHSVDSISPGNQDNQVVDNFNQSFFTYKALNDKITHYKNLIQCYNDYHIADSTCDPCSNCNGEQSKCEASPDCTYDAGNEVCLPDDGMYIICNIVSIMAYMAY